MTDREPVNIMGVIAFPNPNKDERVIRFIDSEYHTLFTIKDGESIVITRFDGEKMVFPCKYIDDCHVCIGNSAYHICEFAEMQERNGNIYVPAAPCDFFAFYIHQLPVHRNPRCRSCGQSGNAPKRNWVGRPRRFCSCAAM